MIFVDTNVLVYAVGGEHRLPAEDRELFENALEQGVPLATSAEVLQEPLHVYLPVDRLGARDVLHLAARMRRDVDRIKTFDRALAAAFQ